MARTNYKKRGSASYIVREVLSVRERDTERERERERERDGSDVTVVALKLAMNLRYPTVYVFSLNVIEVHYYLKKNEFALSLAKSSHNWR